MNDQPIQIVKKNSVPDLRSRSVGPLERMIKKPSIPVVSKKELPFIKRTQLSFYSEISPYENPDTTSIRQMSAKDLMKLFDTSSIEKHRKEKILKELSFSIQNDPKKAVMFERVVQGSSVENFLKPFTEEFIQSISLKQKDNIKNALIELDVDKWCVLMTKRSELFRKIFDECIAKKLDTEKKLQDVFFILSRELNSIFNDSQQFLNDYNSKMHRTIASTINTSKYDDILSQSFMILDVLYNPALKFDESMLQDQKIKLKNNLDTLRMNSFLPSNVTKINAINNFETDMRKYNKQYFDLNQKLIISNYENQQYVRIIEELKDKLADRKVLFDERSDQLKNEMDRRLQDLEPKMDSVPLAFHQSEVKKFQAEKDAYLQELSELNKQLEKLSIDSRNYHKLKRQMELKKVHREVQTDAPAEYGKIIIHSRLDRMLLRSEGDLLRSSAQNESWTLSIIS